MNKNNIQQQHYDSSEIGRKPSAGNVQAVVASLNALSVVSSEKNVGERTSASRRDQFIRNRSKSTIDRPTGLGNSGNNDLSRPWGVPGQQGNSSQLNPSNHHPRLPSPSNMSKTNSSVSAKLSPFSFGSGNTMHLRSSLRMSMMDNSRNEGVTSGAEFRIIHTNDAHPIPRQVWNENSSNSRGLPLTLSNQPFKSFDHYHFGVGREDQENEEDHEGNFDSLSNMGEGTSLNVLRRREPLGASGNKPDRPKSPAYREVAHKEHQPLPYEVAKPSNLETASTHNDVNSSKEMECSCEIVIQNEIGPLGIHVVPCEGDGRLLVQGIEPGGRVDRDGRLAVGDEIIEINGYSLYDQSFNKAQEIFKEALFAKELRLQVIQGRQLYGEEMSPEGNGGAGVDIQSIRDEGGKTPSKPSSKPQETLAAGTKITSAVHANNTRKIGKKMQISLRKGHSGLGFSITTRDNALGGDTPIYIKNIMPKGNLNSN